MLPLAQRSLQRTSSRATGAARAWPCNSGAARRQAQRQAQRQASRQQRSHRARAAPPEQDAPGSTPAQPGGVAALVGTPVYTALQLGELLVLLMLVDAAFSGDWSRIGAITTDAELALQKVVYFVTVAHLGTGAAAGVLASRKGKSPLLPAVKGFLFGALGLYEEQHSKA